jgi:hypothetical protein
MTFFMYLNDWSGTTPYHIGGGSPNPLEVISFYHSNLPVVGWGEPFPRETFMTCRTALATIPVPKHSHGGPALSSNTQKVIGNLNFFFDAP